MPRRVTNAGIFPSDALLELLTQLQLRNKKITRMGLFLRHPDDFQAEIDEAVHTVIRCTVRAIKNSNNHRLASVPLSDDYQDNDGEKMFSLFFANRLIKALTHIVGCIPDGKDEAVLMFLFQELAAVGIRREIVEDNYVFAYQNGEYMVCLHTPIVYAAKVA